MERLITGPTADALKANREEFNEAFLQARQVWRRLTPQDFSKHLVEVVDPIVRAAHEHDADHDQELVHILYTLSLELLGRGLLGTNARVPELDTFWRQALPRLSSFLHPNPRRTIASLTNAICNLAQHTNIDITRWSQKLCEEIAPVCKDASELLDAGLVLVWTMGQAHWRSSALDILARLPEHLVKTLLQLPEHDERTTSSILEKLRIDPWYLPTTASHVEEDMLVYVGKLGGFVGFGGAFQDIPTVCQRGGVLYVEDGTSCWSVHADAFGAVLQKFGTSAPDLSEHLTNPFTVNRSGEVKRNDLVIRNPMWRNPKSRATAQAMVAFTVKHSYDLFLVVHKQVSLQ